MLRSIALVSVLVLAGCGGGASSGAANGAATGTGGAGDAFRTEYRAKFLATCQSGAKAQTNGNPQMAAMMEKICTCSADKLMAGASVADLASPSTEKMTQVAQQCATEVAAAGMPG